MYLRKKFDRSVNDHLFLMLPRPQGLDFLCAALRKNLFFEKHAFLRFK